jgi:hypothetical protein
VRRQDATKYAGKEITSCYYEHCFWSVRQGGVSWEKRLLVFLLLSTLLIKCEASGVCWKWKTFLRRSLSSYPSWIHGQARGWTGQVIWLPYSMFGRNVDVPFYLPANWFRYVILSLPAWMIISLM